MKICTKCKIEKPLEAFSNLKKSKDGKSYACKDCRNAEERIRFLTTNTPEYRAKKCAEAKERYKNNPEKYKEKGRNYWLTVKDDPEYKAEQAEYQKWYRQQDREAKLAAKRQDYADNREARLEAQKRTAQTPEGRQRRNAREKKRKQEEPFYAMKCNMRSRRSMAMSDYRDLKKMSMIDYLGCSWEFFVRYIELQFDKDMTWDNYGTYWHLDEIIPVSAWNFNDPSHIEACWHWTNAQPLFGPDNYKKGGIRTKEDITKYDAMIAERLQQLRDAGVLSSTPSTSPSAPVSS